MDIINAMKNFNRFKNESMCQILQKKFLNMQSQEFDSFTREEMRAIIETTQESLRNGENKEEINWLACDLDYREDIFFSLKAFFIVFENVNMFEAKIMTIAICQGKPFVYTFEKVGADNCLLVRREENERTILKMYKQTISIDELWDLIKENISLVNGFSMIN